jgi:hypothetical protein
MGQLKSIHQNMKQLMTRLKIFYQLICLHLNKS